MAKYQEFANDFKAAFELTEKAYLRPYFEQTDAEASEGIDHLKHWADFVRLLAPILTGDDFIEAGRPPRFLINRPFAIAVNFLEGIFDSSQESSDHLERLAERYDVVHWADEDLQKALSDLRLYAERLHSLSKDLAGLEAILGALLGSLDHEIQLIGGDQDDEKLGALEDAFERDWIVHVGSYRMLRPLAPAAA